jgi:drug/metabolite transporter (DMT)-like permease
MTIAPMKKPQHAIYVLAIMPPLFWAGNFFVARLFHEAIPPFQMSFWRWVLALGIMLPFSLRAVIAARATIRDELGSLMLLGGVGVAAFNCLIYVALQHTTVVNAALINSLMPVATFLLALVFIGDRLAPRQIAGVGICAAGALFIVLQGQMSNLSGITVNRGDVLVLAGLTCWALYTVLIRWRKTALPPLVFLTLTIAFGVVLHLPLVFWEISMRGTFTANAQNMAALLYLAIFPSLLAYIFWNRAVAALGPGTTGLFMYLMPIFSTFFAMLFLEEAFRSYHFIGMVLIFSGIALVTRPPPRLARGS